MRTPPWKWTARQMFQFIIDAIRSGVDTTSEIAKKVNDDHADKHNELTTRQVEDLIAVSRAKPQLLHDTLYIPNVKKGPSVPGRERYTVQPYKLDKPLTIEELIKLDGGLSSILRTMATTFITPIMTLSLLSENAEDEPMIKLMFDQLRTNLEAEAANLNALADYFRNAA